MVVDYVSKYDPADILVEKMLPDKYAEYMMEEYERDKEVQKAQKVNDLLYFTWFLSPPPPGCFKSGKEFSEQNFFLLDF